MSNFVTIQNSLGAGELSPDVFGRTDLKKTSSGTTTCRNFFSNYRGGASSRAGLAYIGTCKQPGTSAPPRDIPFQFSITQGYALEFGDSYMRVKFNGGYVTETSINLTSVSSSAIFTTSAPHGYSVGDWVVDTGNTGFSGLAWIITTVPTGTTFTVSNLFGVVVSAATASSGGSVARIYTAVSPYAAVDLPFLKYSQSADVMTLTLVNQVTKTEYHPYTLTRNSNTSWVFTPVMFATSVSSPTGVTVAPTGSDVATTFYSYVVTAVNDNLDEESNASAQAFAENVDISVVQGSNQISWSEVTGATSYNVYKATPSYGLTVPVSSLFGFIGTARGTSFTDSNIIPDFTTVPPVHNDPFARGIVTGVNITAVGTNYSQQTVGYSVTTSTGSGFTGTPVVTNGGVSGFVINNPGFGYQPSDTIAFTDSGGGLATGTITFTGNPADTNSCKIGGIFVHFATAPAPAPNSGGQFIYSEIENTTALTAQTLANNLNASNILSLSVASYVASGNQIIVTYKTPGAVGNAYTLSTVSAPMTFSGANLTGGGTAGSGATGTLTIGSQSGTYPAVNGYFQQRRVYASSLNNPDTYWMSQPGLFNNMDSSIPTISSDSIVGTPWAQQVNGIQFIVPMPGGLVVLTGKGAWQVTGGSNTAITPSDQTATPQAYEGCSELIIPIPINYDILFVQAKGSIWRDLSYNFFTNIYTGTDLTVLSSHLFSGHQMLQAAYTEEPFKLVWVIRDDGILLCLTYMKEQEVYSWTRHDTAGLFVSVCSVTEPPIDALYTIVKRYNPHYGQWQYLSERMDDRQWQNVEQAYCVDAGLQTALYTTSATIQASAASGTVTFTATGGSPFNAGHVGQILRIGGGQFSITGYTSGTVITGTSITPITSLIPNTTIPAPATTLTGDIYPAWSIAPLVSTVSNLNHLEGQTVVALADGSCVPPTTVVNGSLTLPNPASYVTVGLPYTCQVQTVYLDQNDKLGTVQNRRKNVHSVGVRVQGTRGITVGADQVDASTQQNFAVVPWTKMKEIKNRNNQVNAGVGVPLFTGDEFINITSGWAVTGQVAIQQTYPLPANILSVISYWSVGDED